MFRARKTVEPRIPQTAFELSYMITTTSFGKYYKSSVSVGNEIGVIFLSDQMNEFLSQVTNIQYDGTFFTVPIQFYRLWTILISVGRHILPAIHCLLTGKSQQLYQAILEKSDWEAASRNAFRITYPQVKTYRCWFHFTQRIWAKTQRLGLAEGYRNKREIEKYIKLLMAVPFLTAPLIIPTFNLIQVPKFENSEGNKLEKLKKYFRTRWISRISSEELSINDLNIATNNGAESYHSKLKSNIRTNHPRIWSFMGVLNNIIQDVDNDVARFAKAKKLVGHKKIRI